MVFLAANMVRYSVCLLKTSIMGLERWFSHELFKHGNLSLIPNIHERKHDGVCL